MSLKRSFPPAALPAVLLALLMLTVSVVLGIATRQGKPLAGLPRFAIATVHRNATLIGLGLILAHVLSLLFDSYAKLTPFKRLAHTGLDVMAALVRGIDLDRAHDAARRESHDRPIVARSAAPFRLPAVPHVR